MKRALFPILASLLLLTFFSIAPAGAQDSASSQPELEASFTFILAKMLAEEGSYRQALETFEKAVELAPKDPFVRIEYAELLTQLAGFTRLPGYRQQHLERAAEQVEEARRLAPEELDVLKVAAGTFLTIAQLDPQDPSVLIRAQEIYEEIRELEPREIQARLALAEIYSFQERPERAAEIYQEVISSMPGNRRIYGLLVDALLRSGDTRAAEGALEELVRIDPTALDPRMQLAELQGQRGDHEAAVATLKTSPEGIREQVDLRRFLAFQLYRAGDLEGALAETDAVLAENPEVPLSRLRAVILSSLGRNTSAVDQLRTLLQNDPDNIDVAATLGQLYLRMGDAEKAEEVLRELDSRLQSSDAQDRWVAVRFDLLEVLLEREKWGEVELFTRSLLDSETEPVRLNATVIAAEALQQQGRGEEALALLAGSEDPLQAKRGEIFFKLGREAEAAEVLHSLAASGGEGAVLRAGTVYQILERYEEAAELFGRYQPEYPESTDILFLLGASRERAGQRAGAVEAFQQLLAKDPDSHQALNYLGYMWAEKGENLPQALEMIEKAVAMEPENGAYIDSLGWVYYQLGRYEEALTELRKAVALTGQDATVLEHLGDAYLALGRAEEAREVYSEALQLEDANAAELRRKLAPLKTAPGSSR